ncbi:MAG: hypothetical protein BWZ10_02614 [candidate division BRC1 bacterium ADurb.BinA364]|nr:MAG: hypothetical protein BWZ10_02614 [candidate division BRC1 bacterium ADurb.BinA364]
MVWRYEDRAGFFSAYRAGVQRLPNGNTLIAESDAGRIFEVTPEKEIVWDYYHPFLAQRGVGGTQGLHVYRATRYSETQVENVLAAWADDPVVAVASPNHIHKVAYGAALQMYRDGLRG